MAHDVTDQRITALEARVVELMARLAKVETDLRELTVAPDSDGWISNGYPGDDDTLALLCERYGRVSVAQPKETAKKSASTLAAEGFIGYYAVRM